MDMENRTTAWKEWQIEKQIGKGSYGTVYKAVRKEYGVVNYSAIKVINIPFWEAEVDELKTEGYSIQDTQNYYRVMVEDFIKEIQYMENFKGYPNIVSVEDYKVIEKENEVGFTIYIRMELLTPLTELLGERKLTQEDVVKIGCDICSALEQCRKQNIIHRDIKPENIFVNEFGFFKLGDFGVARSLDYATCGLSQKGTYNYMAPEIITGSDYDERADIYSLGLVLFRLLNNNRLPFMNPDKQLLTPSEKANAIERRLKGEKLEKPKNASDELSKVILKACEYLPEKRYNSAEEMKQDLIRVLENKPENKSEKKPENEIIENEQPRTVIIENNDTKIVFVDNNQNADETKHEEYEDHDKADEIRRRRFWDNMGWAIMIILVLVVAVAVGAFGTWIRKEIKNSKIFEADNNKVLMQEPTQAKDYTSSTTKPNVTRSSNERNLLSAKQCAMANDYYEAAQYVAKVISDKEWLESNFETKIVTNPDFEGFEDDVLGKKIVIYYNEEFGLHEYHVYDENIIDYYEFKFFSEEDPDKSVSFSLTPDGEYIKSEHRYVEELYATGMNIARDNFNTCKKLLLERKREEAGQYLVNAMKDRDWVESTFQIEEIRDPEAYRGCEKTVLYWKLNCGYFSAAVSEMYVNDTADFDYYIVRVAYDEKIDDIEWFRYSPDGTYLGIDD